MKHLTLNRPNQHPKNRPIALVSSPNIQRLGVTYKLGQPYFVMDTGSTQWLLVGKRHPGGLILRLSENMDMVPINFVFGLEELFIVWYLILLCLYRVILRKVYNSRILSHPILHTRVSQKTPRPKPFVLIKSYHSRCIKRPIALVYRHAWKISRYYVKRFLLTKA